MTDLTTILNLLVLLANLGVLGITVKLYTEILKDKKFDSRAEHHGHDGGLAAAPTAKTAKPYMRGDPVADVPRDQHGRFKDPDEIPF